jgi:MFS family permease
MVIGLGLVSLAADMVADGGKSLFGPLLGSLGASALVIGLTTGSAEAMSLVLRLVSGPLADRTGNHWSWTIGGYALTAVCIPLLAVAPFVGAAGLALAVALILAERAGKAFRSPSKTALLAHATGAIGRGRGFGVHKALDLIGAFSGPLLVAALVAATGAMWPGFLVLVVPGVLTMALLFWLRFRVPDPSVYDPAAAAPPDQATSRAALWARSLGRDLPRAFFEYAAAVGLTTGGLVSYGIISFHFVRTGLFPLATIPIVFAGAMGAAFVAALVNGWLYDRVGARVLLALPLLVAAVPPLALAGSLALALVGMACWGFAGGLQDSTIKALVADLVPAPRRATAYGVFAAIQGLAAMAGGVAAGALYESSLTTLTIVVAVGQVFATILMVHVLSARPKQVAD